MASWNSNDRGSSMTVWSDSRFELYIVVMYGIEILCAYIIIDQNFDNATLVPIECHHTSSQCLPSLSIVWTLKLTWNWDLRRWIFRGNDIHDNFSSSSCSFGDHIILCDRTATASGPQRSSREGYRTLDKSYALVRKDSKVLSVSYWHTWMLIYFHHWLKG